MPSAPLPSAPESQSLASLLEQLPQHHEDHGFGQDLDDANRLLLSDAASVSEKIERFGRWVARHQPCLFGRMAARGVQELAMNICWISEQEVARGDAYLREKIQRARREWKERAGSGGSHGLLVIFNCRRLALAKPGVELLEVCKHLAGMYLVEEDSIECDVIYTEAVPLRDRAGQMRLFKAGVNIFYTGAHGTLNHDRRIPGGLMLSINSVGHYANTLLNRGQAGSLEEATDKVFDLAVRSIGNGGVGEQQARSMTHHNREPRQERKHCPLKRLPHYVPADFSHHTYSGFYHTDVLVPSTVTLDGGGRNELAEQEVWSDLSLSYISAEAVEPEHEDYGMFHGHPVSDEAMYDNPWPPLRLGPSPNRPSQSSTRRDNVAVKRVGGVR